MTLALKRHPRKVTAAALAAAVAVATPFVMGWEGDGGRVGYVDVVGVPTYCYGGTGPEAVVGKRYTAQECRGQLAGDVRAHAQAIAACIRVSVPRDSLAAFVSFSFNVGAAGFCRSGVARKLNAGDLAGACAGLSDWVYGGAPKRRIQGLINRRAAERRLCEQGLA